MPYVIGGIMALSALVHRFQGEELVGGCLWIACAIFFLAGAVEKKL